MLSAVGALHGSRALFARGAGGASEHTIFAAASLSKLVVAAVALRLLEQKRLPSLELDVAAALPSLRLHRPLSLRDLLTHTSGLRDDESALLPGRWKREGSDFVCPLSESCAGLLAELGPSAWAPGPPPFSYHYSNMGMTLAAAALESVSDTPFSQLARELVFAPLGMARSSFLLSESLAQGGELATPHGEDGAEMAHYCVAQYPAAGLRTTVSDFLLFVRALADSSLLTPASRALMFPSSNVQGLGWWGADATYGEGLSADCAVWAHGGFMQGIRTHVFLWPGCGAALVYLQNGEALYGTHIAEAQREIAVLTGLPLSQLRIRRDPASY